MKHYTPLALAGAVTLVLGLLASRHAARPATAEPEGSVADLAGRLQERLSGLRVVAARADGDLRLGAYLCDSHRELPDLCRLAIDLGNTEKWTGVVFCQRLYLSAPVDYDDWGDNGLRHGPFLFFGDPEMIIHIRDALQGTGPKG